MQATLNGLLARRPSARFAAPERLLRVPAPVKLEPDVLVARLRGRNPQLFAGEARKHAAEKNRELTYKNGYPDFAVEVSPIEMGSRIGEWEVMLEVNIPLQQRTRRWQESEAESMLSAARMQREAAANRLIGELFENVSGLLAAQRIEMLTTTSLLMHTIRVLEQAGAASIHIEDQYFPKRARYHMGVEEIISMEEMVQKIRAAKKARQDPDFAIVARTDAMRTHGYTESVRRANEYVKAGADLTMLFPDNEEQTVAARKDIPDVPLIYVNSTGNRFCRGVYSARQLENWGYKILYDAISTVNVAAQALLQFYGHLKKTGEHGLDIDRIREVRLQVGRAIGLEEMYRLEEETIDPIASHKQ